MIIWKDLDKSKIAALFDEALVHDYNHNSPRYWWDDQLILDDAE